jgi:hypothetical protein
LFADIYTPKNYKSNNQHTMNPILQLFLTNALINIGDSDERVQKLTKAAEELSKSLKKDLSKIPAFVLTALDPDIPDNEPVLIEVETFITKQWQLMRNVVQRPTTICRAVILQSLQNLLSEVEKSCAIIWLTGSDYFPFTKLNGREREIIADFIQYCGDVNEQKGIESWSVGKEIKTEVIPKFRIDLKIEKVSAKEELLSENLMEASKPTDGGGRNRGIFGDPNWHVSFAPLAARAITEAINVALESHAEKLNTGLTSINKGLNNHINVLNNIFTDMLRDVLSSTIAAEKRSQLLWWKETLYSRSLRKSYRNLSKYEGVIALAYDYAQLLSGINPVSADYLLKEVFKEVFGGNEIQVTLGQFLDYLSKEENQDFLSNFVPQTNNLKGRTDLLSFAGRVVHTKIDIEKETLICLGLDPDTNMNYDDLVVWFLHNYLVQQLTTDNRGKK